jgi:phospholipase/lecithinase/hemolysin
LEANFMRHTQTLQPRRIGTLLIGALLALAVAAPIHAEPQPVFDRIVVFGTSLSDPGNAFAMVGGTNVPPDYSVNPFLVPDRPYVRGGHHFTNGSTWIEQFAQQRGLTGSVNAAYRASAPGATNYAVGAARAYDDWLNVNLTAQVDAYLIDAGGVASENALFVIEMGGNDVRDALVTFAAGGNGSLILQSAVASVAVNVGRLHAAGARQFLIWNAPNVALTPAIRGLDLVSPGAAALATLLTTGFNAGLSAAVAHLSLLPAIQISWLDAYGLLNDIVAAPSAFGLANVTDACITPAIAPFVCQQPNDFLFWDGIHPTSAAHAIIAREASSALGLE